MSAAGDRLSRRALLAGALATVGTGELAGCTSRAGTPPAVPSGPSPTPSASAAATLQRPPTSPAHHGPGPDITRGPASVPAVALTFHGAGDPAVLTRMLADLKARDARVTVLAVGQWLAGRVSMAAQILDAGHELGNHTWSHRTMPRLTAAQTWVEVERGASELRRLTGGIGAWFRPSGTPHSTAVIRAAAVRAGYGACLGYDVDPLDYTDPGPDLILRRLNAQVRAGSIVSLHLGHAGTVTAMPRILDLLERRGLRAVTASELVRTR
jgi:peptidoglycan/xylan/chitin deacetylase (PgdA/CDA1 family)